jgi:septation ring formation regulator EzrA
MPNAEIKKLHKISGKSEEKIENMWEKLKKEADNNQKVNNKYAYTNGTLEKIYGKKK